MPELLKVGVTGASLQHGWASMSHIPALKGVSGVELSGVTGRTQEDADQAANQFDETCIRLPKSWYRRTRVQHDDGERQQSVRFIMASARQRNRNIAVDDLVGVTFTLATIATPT